MPKQKQSIHIPVLLDDVMSYLSPKPGERYLDLTAGYGGHAKEILAITGLAASATLVDRDQYAVEALRETFSGNNNISIVHSDFLSASQQLLDDKEGYDLIVADLGVSSPHLDNANRGFSIQSDGPLDMRMDQSQELTAKTMVNTYEFEDLVHILREYGQEPKAKRIAQLIVDNRPFETTDELAKVAARAWPYGSRVHPATRTFQALRIAVNNELGQLTDALPIWQKLLKPGGRLAVISFHSLEDAIVKRYFRENSGDRYDVELSVLTKKPVTASDTELVYNPRSRSARLRVVAKIKNKTN